MGCERETSSEESKKMDRICATWDIRKNIENLPIGILTVEELVLVTKTFLPLNIETPTEEELQKLLRIQDKLVWQHLSENK